MDALGTIKPVVSQPVAVRSAPKVSTSSSSPLLPPIKVGGGGDSLPDKVDHQVSEQQRMEALVRAAQSAPQPLGSQVFTIFKDSTGQYITQFRDINTGEVTSIPEPQMLAMSMGGSAPALLNIKV